MAESIRIETPDALSGFLLVQKLELLGAEVRSADAERWEVRLPLDRARPRLEEVLGAVRRWLQEEQIASTVVHVDGDEIVLTPLPRPAV
jgi:hypothetical protein